MAIPAHVNTARIHLSCHFLEILRNQDHHIRRICVEVCVWKGGEDAASSCRGEKEDPCLKPCGLGQLPNHTVTLHIPYFSNTPHFLLIFFPLTTPPYPHTLRHPPPQPHKHTHTRHWGRERTPNAISTPLSTFVLMNRGGLVIHQAACCCSRAAGSQNIQAA